MGSLVELQSYTERKGWERIVTLTASAAPVPLPPEMRAIHPNYKKTLPQNLPSFWLSLADPTPDQWTKFNNYLTYLAHGRGDTPPKCLQVSHEGYLLYLMPPEDVSKPHTQVKCCYAPDPDYQPPQPAAAQDDMAGAILPRFLKTQSHIHAEWILGGFAELIHNSLDASARKLAISVERKDNAHMLHFVDNGVGMTHKDLVRMLCFGHEDEGESQRIGKFGVGFKTGSMRIADDAIVFTRTKNSQSVGLLSQTANAGQKALTVPIITWNRDAAQYDLSAHTAVQVKQSQALIYQFSPFTTPEQLRTQFEKTGAHGTHVVLFNLRMAELDFTTDPKDIRVAAPGAGELFIKRRQGQQTSDVPIDYSLRALCSVMFLEPKMAITIRSEQVPPRHFVETLARTENHNENGVKVLLGFNPSDKAKGLGGFMMYWHGVLIQAYQRIGIMIHNTDAGNGVVGVVECNNLEPLNNKQAFNEATPEFRSTEKLLDRVLTRYWYEKIDTKDQELDPSLKPEDMWVTCNKCGKWRLLPPGTKSEELPKVWFCRMNADPNFNTCSVPQQDASGHATVSINNLGNEPTSAPPHVGLTSTTKPTKTNSNPPPPPPGKSKTKDNTSSGKSKPSPNSSTKSNSNDDKQYTKTNTNTSNNKSKTNIKVEDKQERPPSSSSSSSNLSKQGSKLVLAKKPKLSVDAVTPSPSSPTSITPKTSTSNNHNNNNSNNNGNNKTFLLLQRAENNLEHIDKLMSNLPSPHNNYNTTTTTTTTLINNNNNNNKIKQEKDFNDDDVSTAEHTVSKKRKHKMIVD